MTRTPPTIAEPGRLGDFTTGLRTITLSGIAIVIGVLSSFVALALLKLIGLCTNLFFYHRLSFAFVSPAGNPLGPVALTAPILGAIIVGFMARYGSERIRGHGIPEAIEAILIGGSRVDPKVAFLKPVSSAISIGSGGPFGAEGPIIMTGGAFGSLIAQAFSLTSGERKTLLVAGAAAGMSATFAAPLAAMLLAVELLLFEWKPRSFVPVALASATAAVARQFIIGPGPLFPVSPHAPFVGVAVLLCCVIAGLGAGLLSTGLTGAVYAAEDAFKRLPMHWMWWPALGGVVIGLGGFIAPRALGIGFDTLADIMRDGMIPRAILILLLVKAVIWSISLGSGTSGGVLAPLLMMGGALGGLESQVFPGAGLGFWPLVGMGAILGGTMRSPFTGIVFIIELTHDLNLLLPLVVAVTIAHGFTVLSLRRSILTEKVARRGFHVSREYAIDDFDILFVRDAMNTEITVLPTDGLLSDVRGLLSEPRDERSQHLYPILDADVNLVGAVTYAELSSLIKQSGMLDQTLASVSGTEFHTVYSNEPLRAAVRRMAETRAPRLLVLNPSDPRKLVGKIALYDVLLAQSRHLENERRRQRTPPWEYLRPRWLPGLVRAESRTNGEEPS